MFSSHTMGKIANRDYSYAYQDQVEDGVISIAGGTPARWGRMTTLSRVLIVEVGRLLQKEGIIMGGERCDGKKLCVGLVGGTRRGSLHTDFAFKKSMEAGVGLASPALFGYTLPNIPLAEAAGHYGLTGPVYAIFDDKEPLAAAVEEARQLLYGIEEISLMLACEFDHYIVEDRGELLLVNVQIVTRNG